MKLNDKIAKEALHDQADFKLIIAKKFLENIDTSVPYDFDVKHFQLEFFAEIFLLYSNMVIEILSYEINDKFKIFPLRNFTIDYVKDEHENFDSEDMRLLNILNRGVKNDKFYPQFSIYKIREALDPLDPEQNQIGDLIDKFFTIPQNYVQGWDFSKSSLWQLRELRNHVSHQRILDLHYVLGSKAQYVFRFQPEKTSSEQVAIIINDPQKFFSRVYDDLVEFKNNVRKIILHKRESFHYKTPLDFELQF